VNRLIQLACILSHHTCQTLLGGKMFVARKGALDACQHHLQLLHCMYAAPLVRPLLFSSLRIVTDVASDFVDRPVLLASVRCLLVERNFSLLRQRSCHLPLAGSTDTCQLCRCAGRSDPLQRRPWSAGPQRAAASPPAALLAAPPPPPAPPHLQPVPVKENASRVLSSTGPTVLTCNVRAAHNSFSELCLHRHQRMCQ
jgi:hypothetical protein